MAQGHDELRRELYRQLGRRIRDGRKSAGLTQEDLASEISLSRTSVTNIERGRQQILLHTLYNIARALRKDVKELLPELAPQVADSAAGIIPQDLDQEDRDWIETLVTD